MTEDRATTMQTWTIRTDAEHREEVLHELKDETRRSPPKEVRAFAAIIFEACPRVTEISIVGDASTGTIWAMTAEKLSTIEEENAYRRCRAELPIVYDWKINADGSPPVSFSS